MTSEPTMRSVPAQCRICSKPMFLHWPTSYDLTDPMALIPMATCNHCHDLRQQRLSLESDLYHLCHLVEFKKLSADQRSKVLEKLTVLTQTYADVIASTFKKTSLWHQEFPKLLLDHPAKCSLILSKYLKDVRNT